MGSNHPVGNDVAQDVGAMLSDRAGLAVAGALSARARIYGDPSVAVMPEEQSVAAVDMLTYYREQAVVALDEAEELKRARDDAELRLDILIPELETLRTAQSLGMAATIERNSEVARIEARLSACVLRCETLRFEAEGLGDELNCARAEQVRLERARSEAVHDGQAALEAAVRERAQAIAKLEAQLESCRKALISAEAQSREAVDFADQRIAQKQQEVEDWKARLARTAKDSAALTNELENRTDECTRLAAALADQKTALANLDLAHEQVNRDLVDARGRMVEANALMFRLAGEREAAERQARVAQSRLARCERSLRTTEIESEQAIANRTQLRRELRDQEQAHRAAMQDLRARLAEEQRWLSAASKQRASAETELAEALRDLGEARKQIREQREALRLEQQQSEALCREVESCRHQLRSRIDNGPVSAPPDEALQQGVAQANARADELRQRIEWLQRVQVVRENRPWWLGLAAGATKMRWLGRQLRAKGLFDGEAYLRANPDVATSGMSALRHYLRHGIKEGRSW